MLVLIVGVRCCFWLVVHLVTDRFTHFTSARPSCGVCIPLNVWQTPASVSNARPWCRSTAIAVKPLPVAYAQAGREHPFPTCCSIGPLERTRSELPLPRRLDARWSISRRTFAHRWSCRVSVLVLGEGWSCRSRSYADSCRFNLSTAEGYASTAATGPGQSETGARWRARG